MFEYCPASWPKTDTDGYDLNPRSKMVPGREIPWSRNVNRWVRLPISPVVITSYTWLLLTPVGQLQAGQCVRGYRERMYHQPKIRLIRIPIAGRTRWKIEQRLLRRPWVLTAASSAMIRRARTCPSAISRRSSAASRLPIRSELSRTFIVASRP
jgi:hypothetical protein